MSELASLPELLYYFISNIYFDGILSTIRAYELLFEIEPTGDARHVVLVVGATSPMEVVVATRVHNNVIIFKAIVTQATLVLVECSLPFTFVERLADTANVVFEHAPFVDDP